MSEAINIETLMGQARVYASAWSLVDGPFDKGDQLRLAEEEKERLEEMLLDFEAQVDANAAAGNLLEIAEGLIAWHQARIKRFRTVLDMPPDTEVHLGSDDNAIVLTGERLKGFRMGMLIGLEWFEKFPLSIDPPVPAGEDE